MSGHLSLRLFLSRLLQLSEQDSQLPLPVLANLHRSQLRAPIATLADGAPLDSEDAGIFGRRVLHAQLKLEAAYPFLGVTGRFWKADAGYRHVAVSMPHDDLDRLGANMDELTYLLLRESNQNFTAYDPAAQLYFLTLPTGMFEQHCMMLEVALGMDPTVAHMLLQLAAGVITA